MPGWLPADKGDLRVCERCDGPANSHPNRRKRLGSKIPAQHGSDHNVHATLGGIEETWAFAVDEEAHLEEV